MEQWEVDLVRLIAAHKDDRPLQVFTLATEVIEAATPAEWDAEVRKQLPAKIKALVAKVSTATVIGNPTSAPSNPDTLTVIDQLRGVVLQTKHGEPGLSGRRSLTLAVLVGR